MALLRADYTTVATIAALFFLPFAGLDTFVWTGSQDPATMSGSVVFWTILVWTALAGLADAAMTVALADAYHGRPIDVIGAMRAALRRAAPVALAMIAKWVVVTVGLVLLVLPGLLAYARFAVVPATAVLEDRSAAGALERSRDLTRDLRGHVLGVALSVLALTFCLDMGGSLLLAWILPGEDTLAEGLAGTVVSVLVAPLTTAVTTVLYYDLRIRREGYDLEVMAAGLGGPAARGAAGTPGGEGTA